MQIPELVSQNFLGRGPDATPLFLGLRKLRSPRRNNLARPPAELRVEHGWGLCGGRIARTHAQVRRMGLRSQGPTPGGTQMRLRTLQVWLRNLVSGYPLHGEFLALLGAVEKIKIDQLLVRKSGLVRQCFEIVQNVRTQVDSHGSARREERFLSA